MRKKPIRSLKEAKGRENDRLELLVQQAELSLASSSNIPIITPLTVRLALATAFVSPVARSLSQDGQIAATRKEPMDSSFFVSVRLDF